MSDGTGSDRPAAQRRLAQVCAYLEEAGIPYEAGVRAGELVLTLPGEHKLRTVCSLVLSERAVSVSAFVIRHPDENEAAFYRYLLRRNLRLPGLAYAVDAAGDVFVAGRLPAEGFETTLLDDLLGVVLEAADGAFDDLLVLGFLFSMRREWAWRVSRGESTANLEAFRHLLDPAAEPTLHADPSHQPDPSG